MRQLPAPDVLLETGAELGEGPSWVEATGRLSFVDITGGRIHEGTLAGIARTWDIGAHVGAAMPAADGGYLLARRDGFVRLRPDGSQEPIALPLSDVPTLRFNDGKADPAGRAWAGTMAYDGAATRGVLYRLVGTRAEPQVTEIGLSNGLGWSPDGRTMYFIDTLAQRIDAFDFDLADGALSGRRPVADVGYVGASPDGMTVDADGCMWVAFWGGWSVRRFAPDGREIAVIPVPVAQPTSCCFAGDVLVITTAAYGLSPSDRASQPHAGSLFAARAGVTGAGATSWRGD